MWAMPGLGLSSRQHGCCQSCCRGRSLDAESALSRAPEERGHVRVEAVHRDPIGREASKAGPASFHCLYRPVDNLLEPIDRERDIDLLRRCVARIAVDLVVRAKPDAPVALALEIEGALGVIHERKIAQSGPSDPKLDHRPSLRGNAERTHTASFGNRVRPGPGRIDNDGGLGLRSVGQSNGPGPILEYGGIERGIRCHRPAQAPEAAKKSGVQAGDVDVRTSGLEKSPAPLRTNPGQQPLQLIALDRRVCRCRRVCAEARPW